MDDKLRVAVEKLQSGDKQAFEDIFDLEYAKVFARIKTNMIGFDQNDIEDVTQDVFVKVFEKINSLENVDAFEAWMMRIARNTAINEIEKRKKIVLFQRVSDEADITQEDLLENEYVEFKPEENLSRKEIEENLFDILTVLPTHLSLCLQMKEYDGMSYQEIADELGISLSSVKNNIFQCKKKIKVEMQKRKLYSVAPVLYFLWLYKVYVEGAQPSLLEEGTIWNGIKKSLPDVSELADSTDGKVVKSAKITPEKILTDASTAEKTVRLGLDATGDMVTKTALLGGLSIGKVVAIVVTIAVISIAGVLGIRYILQPLNIDIPTDLIEAENDDAESGTDSVMETSVDRADNKDTESTDVGKEEDKNIGRIVKPTEDDFAKLDWEVLLLDLIGSSEAVNKLPIETQMYLLIAYAAYDIDKSKIQIVENMNSNVFNNEESVNAIAIEDFVSIMHKRLNRWDITSEMVASTNWNGTESNTWNILFAVQNGLVYYYIPPFGWGEEYAYETYTLLEENDESLYIKCDYIFDPLQMDGEEKWAFSCYLRGCVKEDQKRYWSFTEWEFETSWSSSNDEQSSNVFHIENVHFAEEEPGIFDDNEVFTKDTTVYYTVDGEEKKYTVENAPEAMAAVLPAGWDRGYNVTKEVGDITGDGSDELILHFLCPGNTLSETCGYSYIYTINSEKKEIELLTYIGLEDGAKYQEGYFYNNGVHVRDGWLELHLATQKEDNGFDTITLKTQYENGNWLAKEILEQECYHGPDVTH